MIPALLLSLACLPALGDGSKDVDEIEDTGGFPDLDHDGYTIDVDCDDTDPSVNPGATEVCNGADDNCDGEVDEGLDTEWYVDGDSDGWGTGESTFSCEAIPGMAPRDGDCDDSAAEISPDATEACDGVDNDCDGSVDNTDDAETWYADTDEDGYGDPDDAITICTQPAGYVDNAEDCDDTRYSVRPDRSEKCNDRDDNCNGEIDEDALDAVDWYLDHDGDGFGGTDGESYFSCDAPEEGYIEEGGDCDDDDSSVSPGADEVCDDGVDNNCDGYEGGCAQTGSYDSDDAEAMVAGSASYAYLGQVLAPAGDPEGDGVDGFYASATTQNTVHYFNGLADGVAGAEDTASFTGSGNNAQFGGALYASGDVDGDGDNDLVVGARYASSNQGEVYVFSGLHSGDYDTDDASITVTGGTSSAIGSSVGAWDIDDDASAELLVGGVTTRAVYIFSSPSGDVDLGDADITMSVTGGSTQTAGTARVGDLDGDGVEDFSLLSTTQVHVFAGPLSADLDSEDADFTISNSGGVYSGIESVRGAQDITGDGMADLMLAVPSANAYGGEISIFEGPLTGDSDVGDAGILIEDSSGGYAQLGKGLDWAGDADLDGSQDIVAGAPYVNNYGGAVYLWYGPMSDGTHDSDDADLIIDYADSGYGYLGSTVAGAGDLDGDHYDDLLLNAPYGASYKGAVFQWLGGE